jgi:RNA-directed DNA polymerase
MPCDRRHDRRPLRRRHIVGFQHRSDADQFLVDLNDRLAKFALALHPQKTRLIEFGRFVANARKACGERKPETFDFLGFTHICGAKRKRRGFQLWRKTSRKRKWVAIREIDLELRRIRHRAVDEAGPLAGIRATRLLRLLCGADQHRVGPSFPSPLKVRWCLSLRRRSQRHALPWRRMNVIVARHLPFPTVLHPWPEQRFLVKHRRQEPYA